MQNFPEDILNQAKSLLNVNLSQLQLVPEKVLFKSYTSHKHDYFGYAETLGAIDPERLDDLESYILSNCMNLQNDDDFNVINTSCEFDYYLKVLRRYVTIAETIDKLDLLAESVIPAAIRKIGKSMDKLNSGHEEYEALLDEYCENHEMLENARIELLAYLECAFNFAKKLDYDVEVGVALAPYRMYPNTMKLYSCNDFITTYALSDHKEEPI